LAVTNFGVCGVGACGFGAIECIPMELPKTVVRFQTACVIQWDEEIYWGKCLFFGLWRLSGGKWNL